MELKGIIAIIVFVLVAGIIVYRNWPSKKPVEKAANANTGKEKPTRDISFTE